MPKEKLLGIFLDLIDELIKTCSRGADFNFNGIEEVANAAYKAILDLRDIDPEIAIDFLFRIANSDELYPKIRDEAIRTLHY